MEKFYEYMGKCEEIKKYSGDLFPKFYECSEENEKFLKIMKAIILLTQI